MKTETSHPWYHIATPCQLNQLLGSTDYFHQNGKVVPAVVTVLNKINSFNQSDTGRSRISHKLFKSYFQRYNQRQVMLELESLGLVNITRDARKDVRCRAYLITEKCQELLNELNKEYYHKLRNDPVTSNQNKRRIRERKYSQKRYGDIRDKLKATVDGIELDDCKIEEILQTYSAGKQAHVRSLLISIIEKNYRELKHNETDNRIWTPFAQLPKEIKSAITINGFRRQKVMDIVSAYPSMWAIYLQSLKDCPATNEIEGWADIFLNTNRNPKEYLADLLKIDREKIKEVLIQYFNGQGFRGNQFSRKNRDGFCKFNRWLKSQFPNLYTFWLSATDIRQTGNNIGKYFETRLMLDDSIYNYAESLGIIVGYEYDGMSFYAKDSSNLPMLMEFIKRRSVELLGVQLIFKETNETAWLDFINQSEIEKVSNQLSELETKMKSARSRCFHNNDWSSYSWRPWVGFTPDGQRKPLMERRYLLLKQLENLYTRETLKSEP